MWKDIIAAMGGLLGVAFFVYWIIKRAVDHGLRRSLVKLRADLDRESMLLRIRYEPIFARQAETLIELYPKLDYLVTLAQDQIYIGEPGAPNFTEFLETLKECARSLRAARVYLPVGLSETIDDAIKSLFQLVVKGRADNQRVEKAPQGSMRNEAIEEFFSTQQELSDLLLRIRTEVHWEIQQLLGVEPGAD